MKKSYVCNQSFEIAVEGQPPVRFTKGQIIGKRAYRALPSARFQPCFTELAGVDVNEGPRNRRSRTRLAYTKNELLNLAHLWIENADLVNNTYDRVVLRDRHQASFPQRPDSSIHLTICQIKAADKYYKAGGLRPSKKLLNVLREVDAVRFA